MSTDLILSFLCMAMALVNAQSADRARGLLRYFWGFLAVSSLCVGIALFAHIVWGFP